MADINEYLNIILKGNDLGFEQSKSLLDLVFAGEVPDAQIAAFLSMMRMKTETAAEIAGLASSLRDHAVPVTTAIDNMIDTCGTGGSAVKTFNISTASALVAAGAGAYVAKHGNRAITSQCGSADVLAELGVKIDPSPEIVTKCIEHAHIGFMFAPCFHPAMKYVQPIRKNLGFRTVFNILGPLANPARVKAQVMGVADEGLMEKIAETLKLLGTQKAMVVHSKGMDEISTAGKTKILKLTDGDITAMELNPADFGIAESNIAHLKSGDCTANAKIIRDILKGSDTTERKDIVLLNAAAAVIVSGLADDFQTAVKLADESIANGKAMACLEKLIEISNN